jgi:hypothetical protein
MKPLEEMLAAFNGAVPYIAAGCAVIWVAITVLKTVFEMRRMEPEDRALIRRPINFAAYTLFANLEGFVRVAVGLALFLVANRIAGALG